MDVEEEKAKILFKLLRGKKNIGKCYDRLEHLKRFDKRALKQLQKEGILIPLHKAKFNAVSVNPKRVLEAINLVVKVYPRLREYFGMFM